MHPLLLESTIAQCRTYIEAGDCHGAPPPVERLIDAVVQLAPHDRAGAPGMTDAERAAWLADKIVALGDYAKEAAAMLRRWPAGAPVVPTYPDLSGCEVMVDGEGVSLESGKPFAFTCCDCGLTHRCLIVSEDGKPVGFAIERDQQATAEKRSTGVLGTFNDQQEGRDG